METSYKFEIGRGGGEGEGQEEGEEGEGSVRPQISITHSIQSAFLQTSLAPTGPL